MKKALKILLLSVFTVWLSACKSTKKITRTETHKRIDSVGSKQLAVHKIETTKEFGDTLKTVGYVPLGSTALTNRLETESKGLKITATVIPVVDSTSGVILGNQIKLNAIAKPVKTVSSSQFAVRSSQSDTKTHIDQRTKIKEKPRIHFWVWIGIVAALAGVFFLIRFVKKYFKFFI